MNFRKIVRFEFRYQGRHVTTWFLPGILLLFVFMILRVVAPGDDIYLRQAGIAPRHLLIDLDPEDHNEPVELENECI
ncbi:hypothetical protein SAMN05421823_11822 [Catalinimonas alkaloidigena]|uniref:Uncharacterized protein n=1 Tax=Catalinimonas alkaloidigena TaxID=1075417 RepID=A0A1G9UXD4_9BACT|nr:hypothetical protein [Catalinimonas alkaloidigena]SDM64467.1 hypothetical protein SAMN05421823_11822 [Catalinimonas alkaloidigena]